MTLDPVLAARQEAASLRAAASATTSALPSANASFSESKEEKYELQSRTLLSVERMPEDWEWLDEFNALLGDHCTWDSYPFVPSRNRPLKPRQSICPITGLPAIYKDPRTGIPYANAQAFKIITKLLENKFVWTGGHYESRAANGTARVGEESEVRRGKRKDKRSGRKRRWRGQRCQQVLYRRRWVFISMTKWNRGRESLGEGSH